MNIAIMSMEVSSLGRPQEGNHVIDDAHLDDCLADLVQELGDEEEEKVPFLRDDLSDWSVPLLGDRVCRVAPLVYEYERAGA